jgi:dienelactone hydrolase
MKTPQARYDRLTNRVFSLYSEGRQREALDLFARVDPELEAWSAELAHSQACLLGCLGETTEALRVLQAASDAGSWWDESILTGDDDLAALQDLPEFQQLVELSRVRRVSDRTPPLIDMPVLANDPPAAGRNAVRVGGVVVALHGAGQRASHAAQHWAGVLELGYALISVESSQLMSPMYRTWPDQASAAEDVAWALAQLPEELRGLPVIAAGFSAGGRAALDWALTGRPVPVAGVVVLAPALRGIPAAAQGPLAPATILIGTDDDLLEVVDEGAAELASLGVTVERLPGLDHEFPPDFPARLARLLPRSAG